MSLEVREGMFYWRGLWFSGLVDPESNALYDNPEDSFLKHVAEATGEVKMASRNREELQKKFEADGKTRYVRTEDVDNEVTAPFQYHHFEGTTVTVCVITLQNGFTVVGKSACANPDNFDELLGKKLAAEDAKQQIYALLAFRICDVTGNG